jgi:carnitine-CoA ligase
MEHEPMSDFAEETVPGVLARQSQMIPDKVALISPDCTYTYSQLRDVAYRVSGGLERLDAGPRELVLLMLDNHLDHVVAYLGVTVRGGIGVELNTAYRGGFLAYIINNSQARSLIIEERYCEKIQEIADELTHLETIIVRGGSGSALGARFRLGSFDSLLAAEPAASAVRVEPSDIYGIVYTSGTTGPSKGVLSCHGQAYWHYNPRDRDAADPDDVVLVTLPLFHMAAQWAGVYNALIAGATVVVLDGFHATTFWSDVRKYSCTFTLLLGAMANILLRQPKNELDAQNPLRRVSMTPVIAELQEFQRRFGIEATTTGYGSSEASSPVYSRFGEARPGAVGYIREDFEARVVDDRDQEVEPGVVGELLLRPLKPWRMMLGYHNMPAATVEAWRNLWFHTGDYFTRDADGLLRFVDRKKDAIRRRGENVSSFEVEAEINKHPSVLESAIVAVPSELSEDDILAVVVLRAGETLQHAQIVDYLASRLPYFMVPRYVEFVDHLPKTPTEKVQKAAIRERGVTESTWDREAVGHAVRR